MAAAEVVQLLQASIDSQQHRQGNTFRHAFLTSIAELTLRDREKEPGFSILLLEITATPSYPETTRLSSALCFKNLVRRLWTDEDGNHVLPASEVETIKKELVGLMIASPPRIQVQLGDAISVIADSDFGERWDTLVGVVVNNGVLQVAHSIFKRWRPLFRSDALFTEINNVLQQFGMPFLQLLQSAQGTNLRQWFSVLEVSTRLLYDLSVQDLPPIMEDNLQDLAGLLQKYLQYDDKSLSTDDPSEAGPLESTKAAIFEVVTMWVQKYEDAFGGYIQQFVQSSWTLLTTLGPDTKYDLVSSRALHFLTSVASLSQHAASFGDDSTLGQIIENVVLPNVALRDSDIEMFEDEPIEYTRRDLEGSDSETRRRAATDFLRKVIEQFPERVTQMVMQYVDHYLSDYSKDRTGNWKSKDTAIYLFNATAAIGQTGQGVVNVNSHVEVMKFFSDHVASELSKDPGHIILQVDAIKYLYLFRRQLTASQWQEVFPMLIQQVGADNYVLHTYAAIVIDRLLGLTDAHSTPYITQARLAQDAKQLLTRLFILIERDTAPEKVQENEFLMRCVMRTLIALKQELSPLVDFLLTNFVNILRVIRHNPSNPRFYYYLFEAMGALIKYGAASNQEKLEVTLYEPFSEILQRDVQEFVPYIFQLFAVLLEANPSASLSEYYRSIIPAVLTPSLWESKGNSPALVRLLSSLVMRDPDSIISNNQLEPTLGIFQKLISSKSNDFYGFDLLETIISAFPQSTLSIYYPTMFNLLLIRLHNSKTDAFALRFCRLYHFMSARLEQGLGADTVKAIIDGIQSGLFKQIYPPLVLSETQKMTKAIDRKLAVVSLTKTLGDSEAFAVEFAVGWARTCEALLNLMVNPPVVTKAEDPIPGVGEGEIDDLSFGVGFTQLNTCRRTAHDPWAATGDLKAWVGKYLMDADTRHNGRVQQFVQERLSDSTRAALMAYMQG